MLPKPLKWVTGVYKELAGRLLLQKPARGPTEEQKTVHRSPAYGKPSTPVLAAL